MILESLPTHRAGRSIEERLRYPGSGLRVRVTPFCLQIFAVVSIFTCNFYPFPRGKPWSTRKRQTGTGAFCLLFVGRLSSKTLQHLNQIDNSYMSVVTSPERLRYPGPVYGYG